jgi:tripeptidyl-peptidase-1
MKGELPFSQTIQHFDVFGRYGQHLSKEEVDALVAPHPDSIREVEEWLTFHGIDTSDDVQRTNAGDWITIRVSVAQAERMLGTKYNVYHHAASSERVVRTISYSLPRELHAHIEVAAPTTYFGTVRSMRATSFLQPEIKNAADANEADCNNVITPACLMSLYRTTGYTPKVAGHNVLGVTGFLGQFASQNDLTVRTALDLAKF